MVKKVTIDLADDVYSWLASVSANTSTPVEDVIATKLAQALARSQQLTWQEQDILDIFKERNARPGQMIPITGLYSSWGVRGSAQDFGNGMTCLAAKQLIVSNQDQSAYALTDAGYAHP